MTAAAVAPERAQVLSGRRGAPGGLWLPGAPRRAEPCFAAVAEGGDSGARFFRLGSTLVKRATGLPADRLARQARWFQLVPPGVRAGFPAVLGYRRHGGAAYLATEYVPLRPLDAQICGGELSEDEAGAALSRVLRWVRSTLYAHRRRAPAGVLQSVVAQARARQEAIAASGVPPLCDLAASARITVNGRDLLGPVPALDRLRDHAALLRRVAARRVVLAHGDLHTGNVLYGGERFLLLDPRGDFPNGGLYFDAAYDGGKALHDLHGCYTLIRRGGADCSGEKTTYRLRLHTTPARAVYATLLECFREFCGSAGPAADGGEWWPRALLMEALLLCGVVPFHLGHPRRATLLYLTGIVFLNRWLRWADEGGTVEGLFTPADEDA